MDGAYSPGFYEYHDSGSRASADEVVPLVIDLLQPRSVVDVGCGTGGWLAAFHTAGIVDYLGVDTEDVPRELLQIPESRFRALELTSPVELQRQFDLVLSLEVAEHLPDSAAEVLVGSLAKLGTSVLFSAAIPHQGGEHHVNEQWPDYWVVRFREHGLEVVDAFRHRIWSNPRIDWWYRQNLLLFVRPESLEPGGRLAALRERTAVEQLAIVHPHKYTEMAEDLDARGDRLWECRARLLKSAVCQTIPTGACFALVTDGTLTSVSFDGRDMLPFPERKGRFIGVPADDEALQGELRRLREAGIPYLVVPWSARWWLDCFPSLERFLSTEARVVYRADEGSIFRIEG